MNDSVHRVRAAVAAAGSVSLAAVGHAAAHGSTPPLAVLAFAAVVLAVLGAGPAARVRRLPGTVAALVTVQAALHGTFTVLAAPRRTDLGDHAEMAGMDGTEGAAVAGGGLAMTAAHLGAAAVVALLLHRADERFRRAARLLSRLGVAFRLVLVAVPDVPPVLRPVATAPPGPLPRRLGLGPACTRRGPPERQLLPLPADLR